MQRLLSSSSKTRNEDWEKIMWSKRSVIIVSCLALISAAFAVGFLTALYRTWPYDNIYEVYKATTSFFTRNNSIEVSAPLLETDVNRLILIDSIDDILAKRRQLTSFVWGQPGLPTTSRPNTIDLGINHPAFVDMPGLKSIDLYEIKMEWGVNSVVFHFWPEKWIGHVVLFVNGHSAGGFADKKRTIETMLRSGISVVAFSMPLTGFNNRPTVSLERFGKISLVSHDVFHLLDNSVFSSLKFFLHPICVVTNYLEEEPSLSNFTMIGFSGGGWTTVVYAAVDSRIRASYSISGTSPHYVKTGPPNGAVSDYEQTIRGFYEIANYLELYVMGSYGEGRRQRQIQNVFEPCCHRGVGYETYEGKVMEVLENLGSGSFKVWPDDTHYTHKISNFAEQLIVKDILDHAK